MVTGERGRASIPSLLFTPCLVRALSECIECRLGAMPPLAAAAGREAHTDLRSPACPSSLRMTLSRA